MSIPLNCYENIIGLSQVNCECFPDAPANSSESGLYLDELVGLQFIQAITDCANGDDVWQNMVKARNNAIMIFQADTNALLLKNYKQKRKPFTGGIGRAVATSHNISMTNGDWMGVRLYCDNIKSGVLVIKDIGTFFEQNGVVALKIYNNLGTLLHEINLNTVANTHTHNAQTTIELPLHNDYIENLEYFFIYQYDGVNKPKINDIKCSCGSFKPAFNCQNPYYRNPHEPNYAWANWLMVGGTKTAALPEFTECSCTTNNYMYGLTLGVELKCKISEVLCNEQLDFEGNALAAAMALAIQNKAGEILGDWILRSDALNRLSLTGTEQLQADIEGFKATYQEMVAYIVDEADISQNGCLACKDVYEMATRGIFA